MLRRWLGRWHWQRPPRSIFTNTGTFPAQENVLSTPELLELILVLLPMSDLLVSASRVSKLWNAFITLSPTLQRALFFQPLANTNTNTVTAPARNPLLIAMFPPFFASDDTADPEDAFNGPLAIQAMPWAHAPKAFRRQTASWRRMLVVQPPSRALLVKNEYLTPAGTHERQGRLDLDPLDGLRMGVLYDYVLSRIYRLGFWFWVHWPGQGVVEPGGEILLVISEVTSAVSHKSPLDKRFYSKGRRVVEISFGDIITSSS
ncbi:hypothetical protein C8F01DRAFT_1130159 [Mycena amicta]|nr:hypothetical protein C8F01DRAFT_1130159 [Mycena amicta]